MHDFYEALPKYVSKGRTNILDGAEEVVPLALMAIGLDPNTDSASDFAKVKTFLLSIRTGVTTIDSSNYINDSMAGKIILGQGWSGDVRRIVQARKKQGDITAVLPTGTSEIWADNWCIPADAPHPVAAHAWINWLLTPSVAVNEMNYHSYPIPIPSALSQVPRRRATIPLFNVPRKYTDDYKYILNVSPQRRSAAHADLLGVQGRVMAPIRRSPRQQEATPEAVIRAALSGVAGGPIADLLPDLLPRPDGASGGVLTRHSDGFTSLTYGFNFRQYHRSPARSI